MDYKPKFEMGQLVATRGIASLSEEDPDFNRWVRESIVRHSQGDWGDLDYEDKRANDKALLYGSRLFSAYRNGDDTIWIITEADRSSTCVLLPVEY